MIRRIGIRLLLLLAIWGITDLVYSRFLYKRDVDMYADALDSLHNNLPARVLYFAESSNVTSAPSDTSKRYISEMVMDYFPNLEIRTVTKYASHSGTYLNLIKNIPDESKVEAIVLTMNMRSLGISWIQSDLENNLALSNVFGYRIPHSFRHLFGSLKAYDFKTRAERDTIIYRQWGKENLVFPFPTYFKSAGYWNYCVFDKYNQKGYDATPYKRNIRDLACHFVKSYAFAIDTLNNPRIRDFDAIAEECRRRNIKLIFNILPENVELADTLVGGELTAIMRYNRDLLVQRYTTRGVLMADNLEDIPSSQFIDTTYTSEHYRELGRQIVARKVALQLKKIYSEEFRENKKRSEFINDFEAGNPYWSGNCSRSSTEFFSGRHSNEISPAFVYGCTFKEYLAYLTDGGPLTATVKMKYKGPLEQTVSLAAGIFFEKKVISWNEIRFDKVKHEPLPDNWFDIHYEVTLPAMKHAAGQLQIFVSNVSAQPVFVDDVEIRFR